MWFPILKWIHVLAAIIAVGGNAMYGLWIRRATRDPKVLPFVLQNIAWIDRRVANPCYAVLLVTGLSMALTVPIPLTTSWLMTAIVLYLIAALLGIFVYAPVARRQRRVLEVEGFESPTYSAIARRSASLGMIVTIVVLLIVFLMVVKPSLWG